MQPSACLQTQQFVFALSWTFFDQMSLWLKDSENLDIMKQVFGDEAEHWR